MPRWDDELTRLAANLVLHCLVLLITTATHFGYRAFPHTLKTLHAIMADGMVIIGGFRYGSEPAYEWPVGCILHACIMILPCRRMDGRLSSHVPPLARSHQENAGNSNPVSCQSSPGSVLVVLTTVVWLLDEADFANMRLSPVPQRPTTAPGGCLVSRFTTSNIGPGASIDFLRAQRSFFLISSHGWSRPAEDLMNTTSAQPAVRLWIGISKADKWRKISSDWHIRTPCRLF